MVTLIRLELYKLVRKKSFWISLILMLLFCLDVYLEWVNPFCAQLYTVAEDGTLLHGRNAVMQEKEIADRYQGVLTNETVEQILNAERWNDEQFKTMQQITNPAIQIDETCVNRLLGYYFLIYDTMHSGNYESYEYFYGEEQLRKIEDVFPDSAMPLIFYYSVQWSGTLQSIVICIFVLNLLVIVAIAPVFAEEHTMMMNQLLFTSRFGRRKCYLAKVIAAYIMGIVLSLSIILLFVLGTLMLFGTDGLKCSIQLAEPFLYRDYSYFKTIGTAMIDAILLNIAGILFTVSLSVMASALAKNVLNALVMALAFFAAPVILKILSVSERISFIAPINQMADFAKVLSFPDVKVGNISIQYSYVITGILVFVSAIVVLCAAMIYQNKARE